MGLFLTSDGHFQGWLAALLCCCAVSQDESPYEKEQERLRALEPPRICNTQPPTLAELPATPIPSAQPKTTDDEASDAESDHHASGRSPSLRPLELGGSSLLGREPQHGKKRNSLTHVKRPSISAPYSFRRLDTPEPQRQSLIPLRLGPVVLKETLAPMPESPTTRIMMHGRSDSTQDLLAQRSPGNLRTSRETPYERCWARSSLVGPMGSEDRPAKSLRRSVSAEDQNSLRSSISTRRSSASLHREVPSATLFPTREPGDRPLLRPKSSFQLRKPFAESGDTEMDKEVLELNTIVEEHRAEATRGRQGDHHVPAIAPSMHVNARSETLEAIGSALGRPLTAQANYRTPVQVRPRARRSTSTGSRVSGWLSGIMTSHSVAHLPISEPFYKCQRSTTPALRRSRSETSMGTWTEEDSPSLTEASSPTSEGHSRSHTGESRITPLSPPTIKGGYGSLTEKVVELPWPILPYTAVGLAL